MCEFWIFELKIGELESSELFLTKLSGIDLHENANCMNVSQPIMYKVISVLKTHLRIVK